MNDSLNNKELIAVGHEFARTMGSDTPIIDMAKIVTRLAERLDCTTAALRGMTKHRDALAAENAVLKIAAIFLSDEAAAIYKRWNLTQQPDGDIIDMQTIHDLVCACHDTPATDEFLDEVRAQGVEMFVSKCKEESKRAHSSDYRDSWWVSGENADEFAAQLRQGAAQ